MAPKAVVPIAQSQTNQCTMTPDWFVQKSEYRVLPGSFELLKNGEEAFRSVYYAIQNAQKSVAIICWGFQPSMYFLRGGQNSLRIGELLEQKAVAGVKVRVLCWSFEVDLAPGLARAYFSVAGKAEVNTPGRRMANETLWARANTLTDNDYRYDVEWFGRYDREQNLLTDTLPRKAVGIDTKARTKNLQFAGRGFSAIDRGAILASDRADANTSKTTRTIQAGTASHHQKMVLVDFEDPELAVGFVMGHNMLDEYWDTNLHSCCRYADPRLGRNGNRPREDFSSRVTGPLLGDLFHNFHAAWKKEVGEDLFAGAGAPAFERYPHSGATRAWREREIARAEASIERERTLQSVLSDPMGASGPGLSGGMADSREAQIASSQRRQAEAEATRDMQRRKLEDDRKDAPCQAQTGTTVMAQILRTQPQYGVRDIAASYLQAVQNATQYIYMENQYFRWPLLAKTIAQHAANLARRGAVPEKYGSLHLFVITNADKEGMGVGTVATARTLNALGRADTIPEISRQQRAGDSAAELKAARQEAAREAALQKQLQGTPPRGAGFAARQKIQQSIEESRVRQQAAERRIPELERKLAAQQREQKDNTPIQPEPVPGLRVHVCTLVAPDSPGRKGNSASDGERGLTADERRERVADELKRAEKTVAQLESRRAALDSQARQLAGVPNAGAGLTALYERLNRDLEPAIARRDALRQERDALDQLEKPKTDARTGKAEPEHFVDWVDVYIHAKLMIIDDTFLTLGSANINSRSMETDSELNIALANHLVAQPARKFLWQLHTDSKSGGEALKIDDMTKAYYGWEKVIKENKTRRRDKQSPMASLVEFYSGTKDLTDWD